MSIVLECGIKVIVFKNELKALVLECIGVLSGEAALRKDLRQLELRLDHLDVLGASHLRHVHLLFKQHVYMTSVELFRVLRIGGSLLQQLVLLDSS
jgi:hypothetical protein